MSEFMEKRYVPPNIGRVGFGNLLPIDGPELPSNAHFTVVALLPECPPSNSASLHATATSGSETALSKRVRSCKSRKRMHDQGSRVPFLLNLPNSTSNTRSVGTSPQCSAAISAPEKERRNSPADCLPAFRTSNKCRVEPSSGSSKLLERAG